MVKIRRRRLDFLIGVEQVGHFLGRGYPTCPGLYRYSPYRGTGHVRLVKTFERGKAAECWFSRNKKRFQLVIVAQHFIRGKAGCDWLVQVSHIGSLDSSSAIKG